MKQFLRKLGCALVGHDDPVFDDLAYDHTDYENESIYTSYINEDRECRRCGKQLKFNP